MSAVLVLTAAAATPQAASGAGTATPPTITSSRQAGGNTIVEFTNSGTITGTFNGTFVQTGRMVIHENGRSETTSFVLFSGTADGCGTGTIPNRFTATTVAGFGTGHSESIDYADNTANAHTNLDLVLTGSTFTYSGTYHCG